MIFVIAPASWVLILPIILVEAFVAMRILRAGFVKSLRISALSNAFSTLIGIPIVWLIMVFVELALPNGGRALGLATFAQKMYAVTVQSPWLIPYDRNELQWIVPSAGMFLCIPFYFASVFSEYFIANRVNPGKPAETKRWAWAGNAASYGIILIFLLGILVKAFRSG